jgi:hypothetical protein
MPSSTSKNFATSPSTLKQLIIKFRIYGLFWTIKLTIQYIFRKIIFQYLLSSYSQYNEDLIIAKILQKQKIFYVDVGANDPQKFNNTYHFYRQKSHGIIIEPDPTILSKYAFQRPTDISLNMGVSNKTAKLKFYQMYPDVNSTFSKTQYHHNLQNQSVLCATPIIKVTTLAKIFD